MARGHVREFDDSQGWGTVEADGGATFAFHCTAIADGSRHIDPGTPVTFHIVPGRGGRWEASAIEPRE